MATLLEVKEALEGVNKGLIDLQKKVDERDDQIRKFGAADMLTKEEIKKLQVALDEKEASYDKKLDELRQSVMLIEKMFQEKRQHFGTETPEKFDVAKAIKGLAGYGWDRDYERKNLFFRDPNTNLRGKALIDETGSSGGHYLIPDEFSTELIPLLYNAMVFGSLPVRRFNPSGGTVRFPKMSGGATGYVVGAYSSITASNPSLTQATMTPHKIGALVPIDNALIRRSDPAVEDMVRQDLIKAAGLKGEYEMLYGSGISPYLTGIFNASISSKSMGTDGGKFSASNNIDNLMYVIREVEMQNAIFEAWVFNSRTKWDLRTVKATDGNYILTIANNAGDPPQLLGFPYYTTNQIPNTITQGAKSDTTFLLGGQWSDIVMAVWTGMEIGTTREGSYVDGSGNTISCLQYDITILNIIYELDILLRHPLGMCKLIGIRANDAT